MLYIIDDGQSGYEMGERDTTDGLQPWNVRKGRCLLYFVYIFLPSNHHHLVMAYNREWDQGKDHWNEAAWNGPDLKHIRQGEEDYHGEGKRRKFNNGVRLPFK